MKLINGQPVFALPKGGKTRRSSCQNPSLKPWRTCTHLMPTSEKRTREAVNRAFAGGPDRDDGPTTAPRGRK
ncbi:hypothetical protein [Streptomyces chartreusis]|uniref:hypothetical protein n=1 Tax=Streptomyces chartreusis TaxID=1969 RepID=UPI0033E0F107